MKTNSPPLIQLYKMTLNRPEEKFNDGTIYITTVVGAAVTTYNYLKNVCVTSNVYKIINLL